MFGQSYYIPSNTYVLLYSLPSLFLSLFQITRHIDVCVLLLNPFLKSSFLNLAVELIRSFSQALTGLPLALPDDSFTLITRSFLILRSSFSSPLSSAIAASRSTYFYRHVALARCPRPHGRPLSPAYDHTGRPNSPRHFHRRSQ